MITIKIGDPQPLDCPNCKSKEGYQQATLFRMHYTAFYNADGTYEGGQYNDGKQLHKGTTLYCLNCNTKLNFKIKKE